MNESQCRLMVAERSGGLCEVRIEIPGVCRGVAESDHHRKKRSHGGVWTPENIVDACGHGTTGCHGWIEANPASARKRGLWLFAGQEPQLTPVRLTFRGITSWWLLDGLGNITWLSRRGLELASR